ncbi:MAG TPA: PilT/PilU family type 4a pilus ATPase [Clostridiales bacterium]|nr:PilT/PilU family type 4a pilus ATPase [Clostridiales bacterium]
MKDFRDIIARAVKANASDIFVIAGQPLSYKVGKEIIKVGYHIMMPEDTRGFLEQAYAVAGRNITHFVETGDDDFAISIPGLTRLRLSAFKQRGSWAAVVRIISFSIPDYRKINIPESVMSLATINRGLVLVTGTAGSGKSTTLSCIIDRINRTRSGHIITLEDPIEFLYRNINCIISQREINLDTEDFVTSLRASLRQSPDVILLGEMRDYETIKTALTAVETGHIVYSTMHTLGTANCVERIVDIFPPNQQHHVRIQLAMLLEAVVSQQLVPTNEGGVIPVFEVLRVNKAIRNLIREAKTHQIDSVVASGGEEGMQSMDNQLLQLLKDDIISEETALLYAMHPDLMSKRIESFKK